MTTNHLTPEQIARGGPILGGQGWGFGMAVVTAPDEVSPVPGRYGWNGGYGTFWFNDPKGKLIAIAMSQTSDILFNGTTTEFAQLAVNS
jgi:CubicO group peptidase (beta-lactamase class C family)